MILRYGAVAWTLLLLAAAPALAAGADAYDLVDVGALRRAASRHEVYPRHEPWGAEDRRAEMRRIQIPEPMVFDLVRGLGARRGELEVNTLFQMPYRDGDAREVLWAPEIEYAVADGLALEFELPFEGTHLEALKLAAQATFPTRRFQRFLHGVQLIVERQTEEHVWETTLLYVPGIQWNETFSTLAMVGAQLTAGTDVEDGIELIANLSLFADVGPRTTVGLEANYASGLERSDEHLLLMPQIHQELGSHWMLQAGVGARMTRSDAQPELAARIIYTF